MIDILAFRVYHIIRKAVILLKTFGEKLIEAREKQNLTQKALAEILGITPTRLNYWEKDKREPNIAMIRQMSIALNISISELLELDEFDKQYPDAGIEYTREQAVRSYLTTIGYSVNAQVVKWHWEDENETDPAMKVQIPDEVEYILTKDEHTAIFTQAEFEELQAGAKEAIEGRFYKKVLEQQKQK